jgi:hypothetical protein
LPHARSLAAGVGIFASRFAQRQDRAKSPIEFMVVAALSRMHDDRLDQAAQQIGRLRAGFAVGSNS